MVEDWRAGKEEKYEVVGKLEEGRMLEQAMVVAMEMGKAEEWVQQEVESEGETKEKEEETVLVMAVRVEETAVCRSRVFGRRFALLLPDAKPCTAACGPARWRESCVHPV